MINSRRMTAFTLPLPRLTCIKVSQDRQAPNSSLLFLTQLLLRPNLRRLEIAVGGSCGQLVTTPLYYLLHAIPMQCSALQDITIKASATSPSAAADMAPIFTALRRTLFDVRSLQRITIHLPGTVPGRLYRMLADMPSLTDVDIFVGEKLRPPKRESFQPLKKLERLALTGSVTSVQVVGRTLSDDQELTALDLTLRPIPARHELGEILTLFRLDLGAHLRSLKLNLRPSDHPLLRRFRWSDVQTILSCRMLEDVVLDIILDVDICEADEIIKAVAEAWPSLKCLALHNRKWSEPVTLPGLEPLARSCRHLQQLSIAVTVEYDYPPRLIPASSSDSLRSLSLGHSQIGDEMDMEESACRAAAAARIIDGFWPKLESLTTCDCLWEDDHNDDDFCLWSAVWKMIQARRAERKAIIRSAVKDHS